MIADGEQVPAVEVSHPGDRVHAGLHVLRREEAAAGFALPPSFLAVELQRRQAARAPQRLVDGAE